jgi:ribose-phosphate pyrophosphokinase
MEKRRSEGVVSGEAVVGEVGGMTAIIVDDLISGGTTLARAAAACKALGAKRVIAAASHGLFIGAAADVLADPALEKLLVTDSVPPFRLPPALLETRVEVLDSAPLFAEAIRRLHEGGSLVELLQA